MKYPKNISSVGCYHELTKLKQDRLDLLQDHQAQIRHHEQSLTLLKSKIERSLLKVHFCEEKMSELVDQDVWVTAEQHENIHNMCDIVLKEYSDLVDEKRKRRELLNSQVVAAKLVAGHVIGIERGLVSLKSQIQKEKQAKQLSKRKKWWMLNSKPRALITA